MSCVSTEYCLNEKRGVESAFICQIDFKTQN